MRHLFTPITLLSHMENLKNNYLHCYNAQLFSPLLPFSFSFPAIMKSKHSFPSSFHPSPGENTCPDLSCCKFFQWASIPRPCSPWYFSQFTGNYILTPNLIGCEDGCMVMEKSGQVENSQFLCILGVHFFSKVTFKVKSAQPQLNKMWTCMCL